jgi:two-component system sensor kinase FixL
MAKKTPTETGTRRAGALAAQSRRAPRGSQVPAGAAPAPPPSDRTEVATLLLGPDHVIRRFSPAAGELLHLSATDIGRRIGELDARVPDPELLRDADSVLYTLMPAQREMLAADGRWYLRRVSPYRALDDRIRGLVITFADVTALKEARERLRQLAHELEERIREGSSQLETEVAERERTREALRTERDFVSTVFETTSALIVVFDRAGRIARFNRACELATGYGADEVEGRSIWDLQLAGADELDAARHAAGQVFAGGAPVRRNGQWHHRDGAVRQLAWTYAALHDSSGAIEYLVASAVDVTAQHAAEQALRAERDLVESVLETVPALIIVADRDGRIVRFNRACEQSTGYLSEEVAGREIWDLVLPAEEIAAARTLLAAVQDGGTSRQGESSVLHRDGSRRRVAWTVSALTNAQHECEYLIATGVDITESRAAAARERERLEELAQLHRLHTAGELAAMLAHELNQPLAAIAHYTEAGLQRIAAENGTTERLRGFFVHIAEQALRAGRTIQELRTFLTKTPIDISVADPNAAARSAQNLTAPYARSRGTEVRLDLDDAAGTTAGSAVQIEHILVNLIRNAVEAIASAGMATGTITLSTRRVDGGMLRITVEDSGPGLSAAEVDKVFSTFYTTKTDGLGMGLRISRRLAEAQGGRLWVEPSARGARFHLDLPVSE